MFDNLRQTCWFITSKIWMKSIKWNMQFQAGSKVLTTSDIHSFLPETLHCITSQSTVTSLVTTGTLISNADLKDDELLGELLDLSTLSAVQKYDWWCMDLTATCRYRREQNLKNLCTITINAYQWWSLRLWHGLTHPLVYSSSQSIAILYLASRKKKALLM